MTDTLVAPALPDLDGWEQVDERTETLFEMMGVEIRGATRRCEDERTRERLRDATGIDHPVRFFAATRLAFRPSLPPGVSPKLFASTLRSELRSAFADELRERGLGDVERERKERHKLPDRSRTHLTAYTATAPLSETDRSLALECWVGLWINRGTVRVLSGGFPRVTLDTQFGIDASDDVLTRSPGAYRDEFFETVDETVRLATANE